MKEDKLWPEIWVQGFSFFPWNFNAKKDFCIWNSPFPAHLYIIQAACGSWGTSLDIKFSLNSLRIEQLHLSNYHRFVIMRGVWEQREEGHGDEREVQNSQGQGNPGTKKHWDCPHGSRELGERSVPGGAGMPDRAIHDPRSIGAFTLFPGMLVSFPLNSV